MSWEFWKKEGHEVVLRKLEEEPPIGGLAKAIVQATTDTGRWSIIREWDSGSLIRILRDNFTGQDFTLCWRGHEVPEFPANEADSEAVYLALSNLYRDLVNIMAEQQVGRLNTLYNVEEQQ